MAECKLIRLLTCFTPEKIRLVIELAPLGSDEFDLPMDEAGNKLSAVANYARTTFGVRTSPALPSVSTPEQASSGKPRPLDRAERRNQAMSKMIKAGGARALQVFEEALARAKASKDPREIEIASEQLARAKAMQAKQK